MHITICMGILDSRKPNKGNEPEFEVSCSCDEQGRDIDCSEHGG
jgi:hypothetical protein